MFLEVITPEKKIYEGNVISATFPGVDGSFQVLKRHAPMISTCARGLVKIKSSSEEKSFTIDGGVVEVLKNKVVLLAEKIIA
ncbi:MAG TPA: ATP synthase F1 subunit epsilon [Cytophagales bacterium]|jgi:F-type H+-transporting ATPase subunit epsilon|nr:ATP synthase F1 subunit epsilon [Cytophagales bacterium]